MTVSARPLSADRRSRSLRRLGVIVAVIAAFVGLGFSGVGWSAPAHAAEPKLGLDWGIKESWRNYVGKPESVTGGASINADGSFHFTPKAVTYDPATKTTKASFSGTVRYRKYCGLGGNPPDFCVLDSTYADPEVSIGPGSQSLSFEMQANSRQEPPKPGTPPKNYGRIVMATLGVDGATVSTDGGTTSWSGITTAVAPGPAADAMSYSEGTRLDNLGFSYVGAGGKPELGERFARPGAPIFANEQSFYNSPEEGGASDLNRPYVGSDGQTVFFVGVLAGSTSAYPRVQALDATSLAPLNRGELRLEVPGATVWPGAMSFDPATNTFYYSVVRHDDQSRTVRGATWTGSQWRDNEVGRLSKGSVAYPVWSPATGELVVFGGGPSVAVFQPGASGWTAREHALPPASTLPFLKGIDGDISFDEYFSSYFRPSALRDGSIIVPNVQFAFGNAGATGLPMPRIIVPKDGTGAARVEEVRGSVLTQSDPSGVRWPFNRAESTADGFVMIHEMAGGNRWARVASLAEDGSLTIDETIDGETTGLKEISAVHVGDEGSIWVLDGRARKLVMVRAGAVVGEHDIPDTRENPAGGEMGMAHGANGTVYVTVFKGETYGVQRVARVGTTPRFTTSPQSQAVTLRGGEASRQIELTAAAEGEPTPTLRWQSRSAGGAFTDIPGGTTNRLKVDASFTTDGTQYRVIAETPTSKVVSETATISVHSPPMIVTPPADLTVEPGQPATFSVQVEGSTPLAVAWERRGPGGEWSAVRAGRDVAIDEAQLTITKPSAELDRSEFRAVASNDYGTVSSTPARLRVGDGGTDAQETAYKNVVLEWAGSREWQARPPDGSAAHYFSAGVSDGTQRTYSASKGGFEVVQRTTSGKDSTATWARRGDHLKTGGNQVMRLGNGEATVRKDGSATIAWKGAFSVNFYDGLVPFAVTNPRLLVHADGSGTLKGDLSGYAGDIANPSKPKEPARPAPNTTIAQFTGVKVDTTKGFTITPQFSGVRLTVPADQAPQQRTSTGWGSWPQEFVNFHFGTGLAAYFYTTGGSLDAAKEPAPLALGFDRATTPKPPTRPDPPGPSRPGPSEPVPPTINTPVGRSPGSQVVAGQLAWGVKASFRRYITGPIAKGRVDLSAGAAYAGGAYRFGQLSTTWNAASGLGQTAYRGGIRFYGHKGILNLALTDPQVRIDSARQGMLLMKVNGRSVELASLNLGAANRQRRGSGMSYRGVPATLTAAGSRVFSYQSSTFYQPGTAMDPLSFVIGRTASASDLPRGGDLLSPRPSGTSRTPALAPVKLPPAKPIAGCTLKGGTLSWGFKESFRSYISGSIANGDWTTDGGATYATPAFGWNGATGSFDGKKWAGEVAFKGQVRFTGHKGLLDTSVGQPRIRFVDAKTAYLILDVAGVTMEDALVGRKDPLIAKNTPFAKLDLSKATISASQDGATITATKVPTSITQEGFTTFPNYPAGTAFDPVSFTITVGNANCGAAARDGTVAKSVGGPDSASSMTVPSPPKAAGTQLSWPMLGLGGLGVLVLGAGAGVGASRIMLGRKLAALGLTGASVGGSPHA